MKVILEFAFFAWALTLVGCGPVYEAFQGQFSNVKGLKIDSESSSQNMVNGKATVEVSVDDPDEEFAMIRVTQNRDSVEFAVPASNIRDPLEVTIKGSDMGQSFDIRGSIIQKNVVWSADEEVSCTYSGFCLCGVGWDLEGEYTYHCGFGWKDACNGDQFERREYSKKYKVMEFDFYRGRDRVGHFSGKTEPETTHVVTGRSTCD